jgi:hypothetical protein
MSALRALTMCSLPWLHSTKHRNTCVGNASVRSDQAAQTALSRRVLGQHCFASTARMLPAGRCRKISDRQALAMPFFQQKEGNVCTRTHTRTHNRAPYETNNYRTLPHLELKGNDGGGCVALQCRAVPNMCMRHDPHVATLATMVARGVLDQFTCEWYHAVAELYRVVFLQKHEAPFVMSARRHLVGVSKHVCDVLLPLASICTYAWRLARVGR